MTIADNIRIARLQYDDADDDDNSDLCDECAFSDAPLCDDDDCDFANPPEEP